MSAVSGPGGSVSPEIQVKAISDQQYSVTVGGHQYTAKINDPTLADATNLLKEILSQKEVATELATKAAGAHSYSIYLPSKSSTEGSIETRGSSGEQIKKSSFAFEKSRLQRINQLYSNRLQEKTEHGVEVTVDQVDAKHSHATTSTASASVSTATKEEKLRELNSISTYIKTIDSGNSKRNVDAALYKAWARIQSIEITDIELMDKAEEIEIQLREKARSSDVKNFHLKTEKALDHILNKPKDPNKLILSKSKDQLNLVRPGTVAKGLGMLFVRGCIQGDSEKLNVAKMIVKNIESLKSENPSYSMIWDKMIEKKPAFAKAYEDFKERFVT